MTVRLRLALASLALVLAPAGTVLALPCPGPRALAGGLGPAEEDCEVRVGGLEGFTHSASLHETALADPTWASTGIHRGEFPGGVSRSAPGHPVEVFPGGRRPDWPSVAREVLEALREFRGIASPITPTGFSGPSGISLERVGSATVDAVGQPATVLLIGAGLILIGLAGPARRWAAGRPWRRWMAGPSRRSS